MILVLLLAAGLVIGIRLRTTFASVPRALMMAVIPVVGEALTLVFC